MAFPKGVKISLTTGDEKIARERWGSVHAQVEELLRAAFDKIRQKSKDEAAVEHLKKVRTLTPEQINIIADQARHDVREEDSKVWEDGNHLSPKASIIHDILLRSRLKDTAELRDRARRMANDSDLGLTKKSINDRTAGLPDQDFVLTRIDNSSATAQKTAWPQKPFSLKAS